MKKPLVIIALIIGIWIPFVIHLLNPMHKKHFEGKTSFDSSLASESAYQIGYKHGVQAAIWGCHSRTNKEVYYLNEIKWRAAMFHNRFGGLLVTQRGEFYRTVPVDTNYLEYHPEDWPTNENFKEAK